MKTTLETCVQARHQRDYTNKVLPYVGPNIFGEWVACWMQEQKCDECGGLVYLTFIREAREDEI